MATSSTTLATTVLPITTTTTGAPIIKSFDERLLDVDYAIAPFQRWELLTFLIWIPFMLVLARLGFMLTLRVKKGGAASFGRLREELIDKDNKAVCLSYAGYVFATGLCTYGALSNQDESSLTTMWNAFVWSIVGFALLNVSEFINDKVLHLKINYFDEVVDKANVSVGIVHACVYTSTGIIVRFLVAGNVTGWGWALLSVVILWAVTQISFVAIVHLYDLVTPKVNIQKELMADNRAVGVSVGGGMLAFAVFIQSPISKSESVIALSIWCGLGLILMMAFKFLSNFVLVSNKLLVTNRSIPCWAASLVESAFLMSFAMSMGNFITQFRCGRDLREWSERITDLAYAMSIFEWYNLAFLVCIFAIMLLARVISQIYDMVMAYKLGGSVWSTFQRFLRVRRRDEAEALELQVRSDPYLAARRNEELGAPLSSLASGAVVTDSGVWAGGSGAPPRREHESEKSDDEEMSALVYEKSGVDVPNAAGARRSGPRGRKKGRLLNREDLMVDCSSGVFNENKGQHGGGGTIEMGPQGVNARPPTSPLQSQVKVHVNTMVNEELAAGSLPAAMLQSEASPTTVAAAHHKREFSDVGGDTSEKAKVNTTHHEPSTNTLSAFPVLLQPQLNMTAQESAVFVEGIGGGDHNDNNNNKATHSSIKHLYSIPRCIEFSGYLIGISFVMRGALGASVNPALRVGMVLGYFFLWSAIGLIGLVIGFALVRYVLWRSLFEEGRENTAIALLAFGAYTASGMIMGSCLGGMSFADGTANASSDEYTWGEDIATVSIFFFIGQGLLLITGFIFQYVTKYSDVDEVRRRNSAVGLTGCVNWISFGVCASAPVFNSDSVLNVFLFYIISVFLLQALRFLTSYVIVGGGRLDEEISKDRNWGASLIEGACAISTALCLTAFLRDTCALSGSGSVGY